MTESPEKSEGEIQIQDSFLATALLAKQNDLVVSEGSNNCMTTAQHTKHDADGPVVSDAGGCAPQRQTRGK
jgi:hypothetical protein